MGTRLRQPGGGLAPVSESPNKQPQKTADKNTPLQRRQLGGLPRLCAYCLGQGVILDGFMGQPMFCSQCGGDGIDRGK